MIGRGTALRRRGMQLVVGGVAAASLAVGGVTASGAVSGPAGPAPAAAPVAAGAAGGGQGLAAQPIQQLRLGEYAVRYDIKRTNRYARTVFSEVTDEGRSTRSSRSRGRRGTSAGSGRSTRSG